MRKIDIERAKNYILSHERYKKWLAVILVLALIAGTSTFYALNKPATAVSEETADEVGMSLGDGGDEEVQEEAVDESDEEDSDEGEDSEEENNEDSEEESDEESEDSEESAEENSEESSSDSAESSESGSESTDTSSSETSTESSESSQKGASDSTESATASDESTDGVAESSVSGNEDTEASESVSEDSAASEETEAVSDNETVSEDSAEESVSDNNADEETVSEDSVSANRTEYTYSDSKIKITASIKDPAAIPDDAELVVTELTSDTEGYNYDAYMDALNENAEAIAEDSGKSVSCQYRESNTLMYDIAFISDGVEIEPKDGAVSISAEFKKKQLTEEIYAEEEDDVVVVHLPIKDEVKEESESKTTQEATEISSNDIVVETLTDTTAEVSGSETESENETETVEFSTESFSVFVFTSTNGQSNYWKGTSSYTIDDVVEGLGEATEFAVYANKFISGAHLEGNIKVGVFDVLSNQAYLDANERIYKNLSLDEIIVTKTVKNGDNGVFYFASVDRDRNKLDTFSINTNSSNSITLTEDNYPKTWRALNSVSQGIVYIYELDGENGDVIGHEGTYKGTYGDYTVKYTTSDDTTSDYGSNAVSNTLLTNYIGDLISSKSVYNLGHNFFSNNNLGIMTYFGKDTVGFDSSANNGGAVTITNTEGNVFSVENSSNLSNYIVKAEKDFTDDISTELKSIGKFSAQLANAYNGAQSGKDAMSVINLKSTTGNLREDLHDAGFFSAENGAVNGAVKYMFKDSSGREYPETDEEYLLINIDASDYDSYSLSQMVIDGYNPDSESQFSRLSSHVIYNIVTKDSDGNFQPYEGTVTQDGVVGGQIIAPYATVKQGSGLFGCIIANVFDRTSANGEVHKLTLSSIARKIRVDVTNEADSDTTDAEVKKIWNDGNSVYRWDTAKIGLCTKYKNQKGSFGEYATYNKYAELNYDSASASWNIAKVYYYNSSGTLTSTTDADSVGVSVTTDSSGNFTLRFEDLPKTFTSKNNVTYDVVYRIAEIDPDADLTNISSSDWAYGSSAVSYNEASYTPSYSSNLTTESTYSDSERLVYASDGTANSDTARVTITNDLNETFGTSVKLGAVKKFTDNDWPDGDAYKFKATLEFYQMTNVDSDYQSYVKPISSNQSVELTKANPTAYFDEIEFPYSSRKYIKTGYDNIKFYFKVTEENSGLEGISYDDNVYYICIQVSYADGKAVIDGVNYYYGSELSSVGYGNCTNTGVLNSDSAYTVSFNNAVSGTGNLRIHKMVVNDFGSDFVRNATDSALLSNVKFRITNNANGNYIVFTGFTGKSSSTTSAIEYDADSHEQIGTYTVYYNNSAQWTVENLPRGVYTVEEVADGLTLTYDVSENKMTPVESSGYSRVTKYDLTEDDERTTSLYAVGGQNYRRVFSNDLDNFDDKGPDNVKVGYSDVDNKSHTQTVQVCNYYSTPLAPLSVNKCFSGGKWKDSETFSFTVEAVDAYDTYLSDGINAVSIDKEDIPMPKNTTITVSKNDASLSSNGSYYACANFGYIYYTYEGTYVYKITEVQGDNKSINYDTNSYYVYVTVSKQETLFEKKYKTENIPYFSSSALYDEVKAYYDDKTSWGKEYTYVVSGDSVLIYRMKTDSNDYRENFFYLGADEVYKDEDGNVLAECSLRLKDDPSTADIKNNPYIFTYSSGDVLTFYNVYSPGAIKVTKVKGGESIITSDEKFYFRVYDVTNGKYIKVSGTYISADGTETEYSEAKDRNQIYVGDSVLLTGYLEDSSDQSSLTGFEVGNEYKIVELSDFDTKTEGAPSGYAVAYETDGTAVDKAIVSLSSNADTSQVSIINTRVASLSVNKVWLDNQGNDAAESHTSPLTLTVVYKTVSEDSWRTYGSIELNATNDWSTEVTGLPPTDAYGYDYIYCVSENSTYKKTYSVTYSYDGTEYTDPDYEMQLQDSGDSYGSVTITNKDATNYVLPSTGGGGTWPFKAAGAAAMLAATVFIFKRRKKIRQR
ncbi:Spy0128 family protein [Lachnospiraceae bacterium C1.1]|nr:FctA domain-containing protein [Lachnospiraceae bacterium C1.1]